MDYSYHQYHSTLKLNTGRHRGKYNFNGVKLVGKMIDYSGGNIENKVINILWKNFKLRSKNVFKRQFKEDSKEYYSFFHKICLICKFLSIKNVFGPYLPLKMLTW